MNTTMYPTNYDPRFSVDPRSPAEWQRQHIERQLAAVSAQANSLRHLLVATTVFNVAILVIVTLIFLASLYTVLWLDGFSKALESLF